MLNAQYPKCPVAAWGSIRFASGLLLRWVLLILRELMLFSRPELASFLSTESSLGSLESPYPAFAAEGPMEPTKFPRG